MVPVASAVEHHPVDPAGLGLLGEEPADRLRRGNVAAGRVLGPECLAAAGGGEERPPGVVVGGRRSATVAAPGPAQARARSRATRTPPPRALASGGAVPAARGRGPA